MHGFVVFIHVPNPDVYYELHVSKLFSVFSHADILLYLNEFPEQSVKVRYIMYLKISI